MDDTAIVETHLRGQQKQPKRTAEDRFAERLANQPLSLVKRNRR